MRLSPVWTRWRSKPANKDVLCAGSNTGASGRLEDCYLWQKLTLLRVRRGDEAVHSSEDVGSHLVWLIPLLFQIRRSNRYARWTNRTHDCGCGFYELRTQLLHVLASRKPLKGELGEFWRLSGWEIIAFCESEMKRACYPCRHDWTSPRSLRLKPAMRAFLNTDNGVLW